MIEQQLWLNQTKIFKRLLYKTMFGIKFSIIIPLYNKEDCIAHTINSVLSQTYRDFELIIINDGSTDDSSKIVMEFVDERLRIINKKNGGVSSARNLGIKLAKNEYIALLDADDFWDENYLYELSQVISTHSDAKMFASSYAEVFGNTIYPSVTYHLLEKDYVGYIDYIQLFSRKLISPINSSAVIIHSSVFESGVHFDERINSGEDLLVWLEIAFKYKVAYLNKILSFYNRSAFQSTTHRLCPPEKYFAFIVKERLDVGTDNTKRKLIDGLLLKALRPYYAMGICPQITNKILERIDFESQNLFYRIFYSLPIFIVRFIYLIVYMVRKKKWTD